ncbi:alpha/beta fold hydrolase [Nocardia sp. R16R-3T]
MAASYWDRLLRLLTGPTIAVDLPGHGKRSDRDICGITPRSVDLAGATRVGGSHPTRRVRGHGRAAAWDTGARPDQSGRPGCGEAVIVGKIYHQDPAAAVAVLCNDVSFEQAEWTADQVIDDRAALLAAAADLSGLSADLPRTYIRLTNDACYSPYLQSRSADLIGGNTRFLESGHMPKVSIPIDLATLLDQ